MCLETGLACPVLPPRLEAAFRFAVVAELALQRRLPTFLGGPFRGMGPVSAISMRGRLIRAEISDLGSYQM